MESVSISWDSFAGNLTSSLKTFSEENILSDVTLVSSDLVRSPAHKLVLCSASPVLREIILTSGEKRPLIYLRGVQHNTLQALLQFMYEGKTSIPKAELNDLVEVAVDFEIKDFFGKGEIDQKNENGNQKKQKERRKENKIDKNTETKVFLPFAPCEIKQEKKSFIKCNLCEHISASVGGAKYHKRVKHRNVSYKCDFCDKNFSDKSSLNKHLASIHEGRRYPCRECSYEATQRGSLKEHILAIHKGVRHECSACGLECYSVGQLKKHIRQKHRTE